MAGQKNIDYVGLIGAALALALAAAIIVLSMLTWRDVPRYQTQYDLVVVKVFLPMFVATAGAVIGHRAIQAFLTRKS